MTSNQPTHNREGEKLRFPEKLLLSFCRHVEAAPLPVATYSYTLDNALDFAKKMFPDFPERIKGKTVLDFGCGPGWQVVAMKQAGAAAVDGVDINDDWLDHGRSLAASAGVTGVTFAKTPPQRQYDVVMSLGSMEHFGNPEQIFRTMCSLSRGELLISFCEPWYSPYGTHLSGTTKLPWLNLLFSEKTLMNVRNLYPDGADGATRFEEIRGGLNKMTVKRFHRIVHSAPDMRVAEFRLTSVKRLPLVTQVPLLRELMTSACTCILQRPS